MLYSWYNRKNLSRFSKTANGIAAKLLELFKTVYLVALKANIWYSEDVNKNPIWLVVPLQLNISSID